LQVSLGDAHSAQGNTTAAVEMYQAGLTRGTEGG
jgi:hypothetical protein